MYTQPKCPVRVLLRGTVQLRTACVRKYSSLRIAVYSVVNYMCSLGVVHLVHSVLRELPSSYNLGTHSLSMLFGSYFGELYRSVLHVHENSVRCRLQCTVWRTAVFSLGVIQLVYSALRFLQGRYNCVHKA